jgi:hypothetical protein
VSFTLGTKESERDTLLLCYFPELANDQNTAHFIHQKRAEPSSDIPLANSIFEIKSEKQVIPATRTKILVFTTSDFTPLFQTSLQNSKFELTTDINKADIVWIGKLWKDWSGIQERNQYINQYPGENVLTVKDLLLKAIYRVYGSEGSKAWYPMSFNLNTETHLFVGEYLRRKKAGSENTWIVKPW